MKREKRTNKQLLEMPKPANPTELEILSYWYFGKALNLSKLNIYGPYRGKDAGSAQYRVNQKYEDYHGNGYLHNSYCTEGYDYSRDFWKFVIGQLYCGGVAGHSYGQTRIRGHRDLKRLKKFELCIRNNQSGRLRKPFARLAHDIGMGESVVNRDSGTQTAGRADGAAAVANQLLGE